MSDKYLTKSGVVDMSELDGHSHPMQCDVVPQHQAHSWSGEYEHYCTGSGRVQVMGSILATYTRGGQPEIVEVVGFSDDGVDVMFPGASEAMTVDPDDLTMRVADIIKVPGSLA